jgi:hypothetical protein
MQLEARRRHHGGSAETMGLIRHLGCTGATRIRRSAQEQRRRLRPSVQPRKRLPTLTFSHLDWEDHIYGFFRTEIRARRKDGVLSHWVLAARRWMTTGRKRSSQGGGALWTPSRSSALGPGVLGLLEVETMEELACSMETELEGREELSRVTSTGGS